MEEIALHRNNLPLLFLHLGVALTGDVGGQVAWSSRRSLDLARFVSGDWRSALSWVTVALVAAVMSGILQLGVRMTAGGSVFLLRLSLKKMTVLGSGDHGEDPRPTCHKVSGSSSTSTRFIGSKSIIECDGALPDLGVVVVRLFFQRYHGGGGVRWTMFRRDTGFSKGELVVLLLVSFLVQSCLMQIFVLCGDHMCNLCKQIV
jgi:hypothetical protein